MLNAIYVTIIQLTNKAAHVLMLNVSIAENTLILCRIQRITFKLNMYEYIITKLLCMLTYCGVLPERTFQWNSVISAEKD